jgi:L-threonylcarbamoyladenylate synthase
MTHSESLPNYSAPSIQDAAEKLMAGQLVAFPTETVYGLGADATNLNAVARIYTVKGRPMNHPLIVHVSSFDALALWTKDIPSFALELAHTFWPGPMTLILKRTQVAKNFITGGQDSVGIRVPSHPMALELLTRFESLGGLGIAAPSANRFGQVSPTTSAAVIEEIGDYLEFGDLVLDGGQSEVGIESTIIDCTNKFPTILRPGSITELMINQIEGLVPIRQESKIRASGSFARHYAPAAKILVNQTPIEGQAYYAMAEFSTPLGVYRVSSPTSVEQFAKNLYEVMRHVDSLGYKQLVIQVPNGKGLPEAIADRVRKSAGGR